MTDSFFSGVSTIVLMCVCLLGGCGGASARSSAEEILGDARLAPALTAARAADPVCAAIPTVLEGWDGVGKATIGVQTSQCAIVTASDKSLIGQSCAVTLTLVSNGDGTGTQTNQGSISSGSGELYTFRDSSHQIIVDRNHATGAGCEQDATNVIVWGSDSGICFVTVVLSSTCGNDGLWKVSVATGQAGSL